VTESPAIHPGYPPTITGLLAASIDHLSDAILITQGETTKGPDGIRRIIFVNEAYVKMTGFSREEAIGETPGITIGPASDREQLRALELARAELRPKRIEILKYRKDGSTFWTELDVVPLFDEQGKSSHFLGVLRDITDRKQLQARLTEADRLASIGTLAAGIAHEINNPLSYVLMNLANAVEQLGAPTSAREAAPTELRANLQEALQGAERVRRIVRDIKAFSREEPGEPGPLALAPVVDGALQLSRKQLAEHATIVRDFQRVPAVLGDATRLGQVVLNLLMNAAQALHGGSPEINRVTLAIFPDEAEPSTRVCFEVRDTGPGIRPEILPRVFDPFFTTKAVGEGTGLGLSICHGIVSALGGSIRISSELGQGTTVRVTLPATDRPPPRATVPPLPPATRRLRVLIVDDEATVANALRRALAREHDVTTVYSGEEALALAVQKFEFDVILCDLMMPGLSGVDLHEVLEARSPALAARMVFMTGGAYTRAARTFVEQPGRILLDKPFDLAAVRALLQRFGE
jgi:PAS domain S-box-containing protein